MTIVLNGDTGLIVSGNTNTLAGVTVGQGAGAVSTNTAVGASALAANTSGLDNAAFGYGALNLNTTGTYNTAVGRTALNANTTGSANIGIGRSALEANTTGGNNTAMGMQSLFSNTTASYNTAVGYQAAYGTTTGAYNASFGQAAFNSNTTGNYNTALGTQSLASNTTASNNTAVGYQAGYSNTTGVGSVAIGYQAAYAMTTGGGYSTVVGWSAGIACTGAANTLIGGAAGYGLTTGANNTFIGNAANSGSGGLITTGSKNTIIGNYSGNQGGLDIRTASNYIVLSDGDGNPRQVILSNGNMVVGKTTSNYSAAGTELYANGEVNFVKSSGSVVYVNRLTNDGILVELAQDGVTEGNISVSGSTVSYNGGHLSRWAQTTAPKDDTLVKGTVLSNLDAMNVYTDADGNPVENEQLNKVKVSDVEGDANVAGVFVNWDYDEAHNVDEINMAMTGDMIIRIAQGVTVARGDLLMSAGDGTAKPQGDDIVRSKTVAKVTSTHVTCTYADGSFCVPCVLMAC